MSSNINKSIQEIFDIMNKDSFMLDAQFVPIFPATPERIKEIDI